MDQKIIDYSIFDFSKSSVIKPASNIDEKSKKEHKISKLILDSRHRNASIYPSASSFTLYTSEEFDDVISAELLNAHFPFSKTTVNTFNNKFSLTTFDSIGTPEFVNVEIEIGNYTEAELAIELEISLNNASTSTSFQVIYSSRNNSFTFISPNLFVIKTISEANDKDFNGRDMVKYLPNTMFKLLGFDRKLHAGIIKNANYTIKAPFQSNFKDNEYIIIQIDQFNLNKSTDNCINKSFACINKSQSTYLTAAFSVKKYFAQPISKLNRLTIKCYDSDGNPYDFSNMDFKMEILLTSFKNPITYQTFI